MVGNTRSAVIIAAIIILQVVPILQFSDVSASDSMLDYDRLSGGGVINDTKTSIAVDSNGNIHSVWVRNGQHLFYSMTDSSSRLIADTQISNAGIHRASHPSIAIDSQDIVHVAWANKAGQHAIMYTALQPAHTAQDGQSSDDGTLTWIDDTVVSQRQQNRDWPSIAIDSNDNVHIVWEDQYDELDKFFQQPQIYYSMLEPDYSMASAITVIDDTLLTTELGVRGHPDIAIDSADKVHIYWDDTRGSEVEMVFIIDTSGSMGSEWQDICSIVYGGVAAQGGYTLDGIKPTLKEVDITVYETLYGLGNYLPSAASSGDCANYNTNSGPRSIALGNSPGDDSGGIRKLPATVYNGGTYAGYSGEDWGPGSNWACLSWMDSSLNVPGNPPTNDDHRWNSRSTKIVLPFSDAGPKDGAPADGSDDYASIAEAHDSCTRAGVIPLGLHSEAGAATTATIESHFRDLVQCPDGVQGTHTRNCPGTNLSNSDAGGQLYKYTQTSNGVQLIEEALFLAAMNGSREIFMTILDPYSQINSPGFTYGKSGHSTSSVTYVEDIGGLVAVNDTRMTHNSSYSYHPSVDIDSSDNVHLAWMDARDHGNGLEVPYEVYYAKYNPNSQTFDGSSLEVSNFTLIEDSPISTVEATNSSIDSFDAHSAFPELAVDSKDNAHLAWLDLSSTDVEGESIVHTRLNMTTSTGDANSALDSWEVQFLTSWQSDKLNSISHDSLPAGQPPAIYADFGGGAHVAWSDKYDCSSESTESYFSICHTHVTSGSVELSLIPGEADFRVVEPAQLSFFNLTLNNTTPRESSLAADTYNLEILGAPLNWTVALYFSNNHTYLSNTTPLFLMGGESFSLYLRVKTPNANQVIEDELAEIIIRVNSISDDGIFDQLAVDLFLDVIHGINLSIEDDIKFVEQGSSATFSVSVENTGNVEDIFEFYDTTSLEGQQAWNKPWTWDIFSPQMVQLSPGEIRTLEVIVEVPMSQVPGVFALVMYGWSTSGNRFNFGPGGTADVVELFVHVSHKVEGNIVITPSEQRLYMIPNECIDMSFQISKHYSSGHLSDFQLNVSGFEPNVAGPIEQSGWTYELNWANAPIEDEQGLRYFVQDQEYNVGARICSPNEFPPNVTNFRIEFSAIQSGYPNVFGVGSTNILPYETAIVEFTSPEEGAKVDQLDLVIEGALIENIRSGPVTIDVGFNSYDFNQQWEVKEVYRAAGEFDNVTMHYPSTFSLDLFLLTQIPYNDTGVISIDVRICDQKFCQFTSLSVIWFEDMDDDGWADSQDAFPADPNEWNDTDGDGWGDNEDAFPNNPSEWSDSDGDGIGDWEDAFPNDPSEWRDTDGDGYGDNADAFPLDFEEWADSDGDGVGDNADYNPADPDIQERPKQSSFSGAEDGILNNTLFIIIIVVILALVAIIVVIMTMGGKKEVLGTFNSAFENHEETTWLPVPMDAEYVQPLAQTMPQAVVQQQVVPMPTGPPSHPMASVPANNGVKDGYEWLQANGIDYFRPVGSFAEWTRWN